jgi:hypothetical protein
MHLRYDCYGASLSKESRHPKVVMRELGITYSHATPQSMADQWWFWNCKNVPAVLPEYLEPMSLDPHKCIGSGLSKEDADNIDIL